MNQNVSISSYSVYVPVNSKTAHPPIPGHLTRVKFRTVGNLTQNEARPVGHLTFVSKRLSAVGSKRISQFFDSAGEPRSQVIAIIDFTWVFLLLSLYIVLSWNLPLFKVWRQADRQMSHEFRHESRPSITIKGIWKMSKPGNPVH